MVFGATAFNTKPKLILGTQTWGVNQLQKLADGEVLNGSSEIGLFFSGIDSPVKI